MADSYPTNGDPIGTIPPPPPSPQPSSSPSAPPPYSAPVPLSPSDERMWAMLAHLTVLLNLFTGILGTVAALVIYLVFKDRSRYVAYQSLQSMIMQLILWIGGGIIVGAFWAITGILSAIIIGICLIPIAILLSALPLVAIVYGIIGAVQTNSGQDFKYWLIGDWVRGTYTG